MWALIVIGGLIGLLTVPGQLARAHAGAESIGRFIGAVGGAAGLGWLIAYLIGWGKRGYPAQSPYQPQQSYQPQQGYPPQQGVPPPQGHPPYQG